MHWLDSVVTWEKHSDFQKEFRKMYSLTKCDNCGELFRNDTPGYFGDGRRGICQGFYSEPKYAGLCSQSCMEEWAI
ncbi:hypothetical protein SKAU_G00016390 [Synaphobranchus kaupii]|uniref:CxC7-like cysteine cluster associated with KDZ transposases domain-containing protein n=1 Tax=Synaphobranchus kaupii TaxID=118154 RepID=A0A9Q1JBR8_SYNKA|nr:hypothetical protein SKAU_G00016390 [Synaphobranchus kaupii]